MDKQVKKVTVKELKEIIEKEARDIIKEQYVESKGDPQELKMNTMDKEVHNDGAPVKVAGKGKPELKKGTADPKETYTEPVKVEMNQQDDDQGHDKKIATAVAVEAAEKTKKGGHIEGQHEGKFDSKTENPKVTVENDPTSAEKVGVTPEMNKEDKEVDEGTKTFVEPGAELKTGFSTGQKKAMPSEDAKNEKDDYEEKLRKSVKTVQLPEGFKNNKEMLDFIRQEARKIIRSI